LPAPPFFRDALCEITPGTNAHLEKLKDAMTRYFAGQLEWFSVPLVLAGTDFLVAAVVGLVPIKP
jgi:hypothetical protein